MKKDYFHILEKWQWPLIIGLFFLYSCSTAVLLQFFILPKLLPHLHEGEGLLKYTDCVSFHQFAKDIAYKMHQEGLSVWRLDPVEGANMQPAMIASLFYYFISPKLWVLIPYNAMLHALSGGILFYIFRSLSGKFWVGFIAASIYICFPSSIAWYGQLHRDGLFIFGNLSVLFALYQISKNWTTIEGKIKLIVVCLGLLVLGFFCVYASRDEAIPVLLLVTGFWFIFLFTMRLLRGKLIKSLLLFFTILIGFSIFALDYLKTRGAPQFPSYFTDSWKSERWLPIAVDWQIQKMLFRRAQFYNMYPNSGSNIDDNISLDSASTAFAYLPRALQVAYFSPFPDLWFGEAVRGRTFQRKISAIEISFSYIFYLGIPFSVLCYFKRLEYWILVYFSMMMILPFTYAIPNVGTLYRIRYCFFMMLVSIGVSGLFLIFNKIKRNRE